MKIDEIWEFDNGIAYDLCRIVREEPATGIHKGDGAYLLRSDAEGWTKAGKANRPLKFNPKMPNVKPQKELLQKRSHNSAPIPGRRE